MPNAHLRDLAGHLIVPCLSLMKAGGKRIVADAVLCLILCHSGILGDKFVDRIHVHVHLLCPPLLFLFQILRLGQHDLILPEFLQNQFPVIDEPVGHPDESRFDSPHLILLVKQDAPFLPIAVWERLYAET